MSDIPVAFYAPLKSPDHPVPSGERTMARLFREALALAGFAPTLASELRTREPAGDRAAQARIRAASEAEADRLVLAFRALPPASRPRLWFTYHSYYKAPDWVGPAVAARLGIPYGLAEASRAGKRAGGPFDLGHRGSEAAIAAADALFVLTDHDREALARTPGLPLVDLPPFVALPNARFLPPGGGSRPLRLLTVAMMRDGDKLASYRVLADALGRLTDGPWTLDVVGDGPARDAVAALLAAFGSRVTWQGRIDDPSALAARYAAADLLVWPAVNEAFGTVLLEAQASGCPVLAGDHGGVRAAFRPGATGILAEPGPAAFADALAAVLAAPDRLRPMREAAARFVREERSVAGAAAVLGRTLRPLLAREIAA